MQGLEIVGAEVPYQTSIPYKRPYTAISAEIRSGIGKTSRPKSGYSAKSNILDNCSS